VKDLSSLIGKIAVTDSEVGLSGKPVASRTVLVLIDDEIYEAVTDGEYIAPGKGVKVTRIKGKKIVVKRV
jgi:membrane-bound ClpP family serine protease